jgi:hypothetical protein
LKTVEFEHDIGDRVKVKTIEMIGSIDALCQDIQGKQYRVVYWNDGQRYSVWMYAWEIEATK